MCFCACIDVRANYCANVPCYFSRTKDSAILRPHARGYVYVCVRLKNAMDRHSFILGHYTTYKFIRIYTLVHVLTGIYMSHIRQ